MNFCLPQEEGAEGGGSTRCAPPVLTRVERQRMLFAETPGMLASRAAAATQQQPFPAAHFPSLEAEGPNPSILEKKKI